MHPDTMAKIAQLGRYIQNLNGRAFFVGGCVRDHIMGITPKDLDIEVFGVSAAMLDMTLKLFGKVDTVGKSFGVSKLTLAGTGDTIDISLPQHRIKVAAGHKGEQVIIDPNMTLREAAARRDFTINAISTDIVTGVRHDPWGGVGDIVARRLRHVGPAFADDPLRVLRGVQFAARFGFTMCDDTVRLCASLLSQFDSLPKERIWGEFEKFLTKGVQISKGLDVLVQTGWIVKFPELASMIGCQQNPAWHKEGCVFCHTKQVVDRVDGVAIDAPCVHSKRDTCH